MSVVGAPDGRARTCTKCGHAVRPDTSFCTSCGEKLTPIETGRPATGSSDDSATALFCTQCGKPTAPGSKFCASCGAQVGDASSQVGAAPKRVYTMLKKRDIQVLDKMELACLECGTKTEQEIIYVKSKFVSYGVYSKTWPAFHAARCPKCGGTFAFKKGMVPQLEKKYGRRALRGYPHPSASADLKLLYGTDPSMRAQ